MEYCGLNLCQVCMVSRSVWVLASWYTRLLLTCQSQVCSRQVCPVVADLPARIDCGISLDGTAAITAPYFWVLLDHIDTQDVIRLCTYLRELKSILAACNLTG